MSTITGSIKLALAGVRGSNPAAALDSALSVSLKDVTRTLASNGITKLWAGQIILDGNADVTFDVANPFGDTVDLFGVALPFATIKLVSFSCEADLLGDIEVTNPGGTTAWSSWLSGTAGTARLATKNGVLTAYSEAGWSVGTLPDNRLLTVRCTSGELGEVRPVNVALLGT